MSNIHRLGDFENANNNNAGRSDRMPLIANRQGQGDPRKEHFGSFLKNFCCPMFTFKSFIFVITIIDFIMYIITLIVGGVGKDSFLQVNDSTLDKYGNLVLFILIKRIVLK
jgi:hypothetical protein